MIFTLLLGCPGEPTPVPVPTADERLHDPISMPLTPTVALADFAGAASCAGCHPEHHDAWSTSIHAYAMVDPVFQKLVAIRQADLETTEDRFCVQCHSTIGTRSGQLTEGFSFDDQPSVVMEGITCESCHKATTIERTHNAGHHLDGTAPIQGATGASSPGHATVANPALEESAFCGSCHDVYETDGLPLERPFAEWSSSPAAASGPTCQGCHMQPSDYGHDHRFVGVDIPLSEGFLNAEQRAEAIQASEDLLQGSAALTLDVRDLAPGGIASAEVTVTNRIEGHAFPTGSTFNRQVWIELIARADGVPFYTTGTLDGNGDLQDYWSDEAPYGDPDLLTLGSGFTDAGGSPTLFSWHATDHTSTALQPRRTRTWTLFLPVPEDATDVDIEARLLFRPLAPHLLRKLELGGLADRLPLYEVDTARWSSSSL